MFKVGLNEKVKLQQRLEGEAVISYVMYGGIHSEQRSKARCVGCVWGPQGSKVAGVEHGMKPGQRGYRDGNSQIM